MPELKHFSLWTEAERAAYFAAQRKAEREFYGPDVLELREMVKALVALCEEVIGDLYLENERAVLSGYRERLEKLKGEG